MEMYIVLGVTLFMMISFVLHKVPFGVTTMTCCAILAVTGVVDLPTAFSGFGNKIVVLIAPMLALSAVLPRTSMIAKLSKTLNAMKGKRGMLLVGFFFLIGAVFAQFIPNTASITILVVFLSTLDDSGDITANRLLLPLLGILCAWKFRFPIGMGAATFATINGMYEGIIPDPQYALKMLDPFIYSLIPMAVLTIYCLFGWRLMPKSENINQSALKEAKKHEMLAHSQEVTVYIVFIIVMLLMLLNQWTGNLLYLAPGLGVLALIYAKIIKTEDAVKDMTSDMVWMIAGVLVVADALGKLLLFATATVVMTTFMSNMATETVLIPIAASVALAGGWDPRGMILTIGIANMLAVGFPSGSGEAAVCFAAGGYNPVKVMKFTIPYIILGIISSAVAANIMYPIYG